jgi:hypothetical protein
MDKPKKWHEIYPYGSKAGDEEAKVFRSLSRHSKFDWRSTGAIAKATGLSRERVEEIINKYVNNVKPPLIYAHPSNEDHWGYWERVPEVIEKDDRGISKKDKDNRIDKQMSGSTPSMIQNDPVDPMDSAVCSITGFPTDDALSINNFCTGTIDLDLYSYPESDYSNPEA